MRSGSGRKGAQLAGERPAGKRLMYMYGRSRDMTTVQSHERMMEQRTMAPLAIIISDGQGSLNVLTARLDLQLQHLVPTPATERL